MRPRAGLRASARAAVAVVAPAFALACDRGTAAPAADDLVVRLGLEPLPGMVHPPDNPRDPLRADLGRLLFFDPILSGHKDAACSTCHLPSFGFADGRDLPIGTFGEGLGPDRQFTETGRFPEGRNSMSVINVGFNRFLSQWTADGFLFWDGRRRRLEGLVVLPILEVTELRGDAYPPELALDSVLERLRGIEEYGALFAAAFPDRLEGGGEAIDSTTFVQALSQFVRSLESTDSPYDRFVAGDADALSEQQKRGLLLFHTDAGCAACHSGPLFSDFDFHVVGARQIGPGFQETPFEDFGRWNATALEADRWAFRTPTLRNVAHTFPYMHSGGYATLRDVVEFFARGGGDHPRIPRSRLDPELRRLSLSEREIEDIVAFLEALTDLPDVEPPAAVPSGLPPVH